MPLAANLPPLAAERRRGSVTCTMIAGGERPLNRTFDSACRFMRRTNMRRRDMHRGDRHWFVHWTRAGDIDVMNEEHL